MQFIWEENDIEPGRRVNNSSGNGELIIGYRYTQEATHQPAVFTVVSLDDGLEVFHATLETRPLTGKFPANVHPPVEYVTARSQVADWLNQSKATPKTIGPR